MSNQPNIFSIYEKLLKDFVDFSFTYFPTTNWQHAFSPTFNFIGKNVGDAATEQHVLNEVGSYGMQLNHVLNVLKVIVDHMDKSKLEEQETRSVKKFIDLADAADKAATEFRQNFIEDNLQKMIKDLHLLEKDDPEKYRKFVDQLHAEFPLPKK